MLSDSHIVIQWEVLNSSFFLLLIIVCTESGVCYTLILATSEFTLCFQIVTQSLTIGECTDYLGVTIVTIGMTPVVSTC